MIHLLKIIVCELDSWSFIISIGVVYTGTLRVKDHVDVNVGNIRGPK